MGRTRINQPRAITEKKIESLICELLSQGQNAFPSERELAERTGGSRSVIRQILVDFENNNRLHQTPNGRIINPDGNKIPVLFIASGRNMISNPAWARLWLTFLNRAKNTPLAPELFLIRFHAEEMAEDLLALSQKQASYIICCCDPGVPLPFQQWENENRIVIFTDENALRYSKTVIALDNFKAGEMAAEELFQHDFRTPVILAPELPDANYIPFVRRVEGFARKCSELGMDFQQERDCICVRYQKSRLQNYIRQTTKIAKLKRYDSLFLATDDQLFLVLEVLCDQQRPVPGGIGLITLNAQNNAQTGDIRVHAISHATDEIAEKLVQNIQAHAEGEFSQFPSCSIVPSIHQGETLSLF